MPSSVKLGSRPISLRKRSYSSGFSPCSATSSGVIFGSLGIISGGFERLDQAFEQAAAVGGADNGINVIFRMRHQAENVQFFRQNAGDRVHRAVEMRIDHAISGSVAEGDEILALEPGKGFCVRDIIALAMSNRHADDASSVIAAREGCIGALDAHMHFLAH